MESKYCQWYCVEYVDKDKWLFQSQCDASVVVSKNEKFFKFMYANDDANLCPCCGKIITVGELG